MPMPMVLKIALPACYAGALITVMGWDNFVTLTMINIIFGGVVFGISVIVAIVATRSTDTN
jgi:hypothetical protein